MSQSLEHWLTQAAVEGSPRLPNFEIIVLLDLQKPHQLTEIATQTEEDQTTLLSEIEEFVTEVFTISPSLAPTILSILLGKLRMGSFEPYTSIFVELKPQLFFFLEISFDLKTNIIEVRLQKNPLHFFSHQESKPIDDPDLRTLFDSSWYSRNTN